MSLIFTSKINKNVIWPGVLKISHAAVYINVVIGRKNVDHLFTLPNFADIVRSTDVQIREMVMSSSGQKVEANSKWMRTSSQQL